MSQKLKLKSSNYAYLQIDIAFSLFIFLIIFSLVYNYYAHYKYDLNQNIDLLKLQSDAENICFLLVNSNGYPNNWENDINNSVYFGFKDLNSNELDSTKFLQFNSNNYFIILDKLNISANLGISIKGVNSNTQYLHFGGFSDNINVIYSNYQCYSNYNSEVVQVFVEVWK